MLISLMDELPSQWHGISTLLLCGWSLFDRIQHDTVHTAPTAPTAVAAVAIAVTAVPTYAAATATTAATATVFAGIQTESPYKLHRTNDDSNSNSDGSRVSELACCLLVLPPLLFWLVLLKFRNTANLNWSIHMEARVLDAERHNINTYMHSGL